MLRKHTTDFLAYCKVTGFSDSSIHSLHASLKDFAAFVDKQDIKTIIETGYEEGVKYAFGFYE